MIFWSRFLSSQFCEIHQRCPEEDFQGGEGKKGYSSALYMDDLVYQRMTAAYTLPIYVICVCEMILLLPTFSFYSKSSVRFKWTCSTFSEFKLPPKITSKKNQSEPFCSTLKKDKRKSGNQKKTAKCLQGTNTFIVIP